MSFSSFVPTATIVRANCHGISNQLPRYIVPTATLCSQIMEYHQTFTAFPFAVWKNMAIFATYEHNQTSMSYGFLDQRGDSHSLIAFKKAECIYDLIGPTPVYEADRVAAKRYSLPEEDDGLVLAAEPKPMGA